MRKFLSLLMVALLIAMCVQPFAMAEAGSPKILRYATSSVKGAFNPILSSDVYDSYVTHLIFAGLVSADPGNNIIIDENCVAESYEISEDHLTYTFHLKEGLKFSNGDPITASDVAFTFKMIGHKNYDGPRAEVVADMVGYEAYHTGASEDFEGIKVIDDKTVSFTINEPYVAKIEEFGSYGIMSEKYYTKDTYDEFKALNGAPLSSGPFMLESFEPGQACNMVRNPEWFGKQPALDGVTILMIPPETQVMALTSGQCDLIEAPAANLDTYEEMETAGMQIIQFTGLGYNAMMLNHQSPKLADVQVRKALMHGFDRASFIENEYEGFAKPCLTNVYAGAGFWAYPKDDSAMNSYAFDPELAKQILTDAGWVDTNGNGIVDKDGVELDLIMYIYNDSPWPEHLAALLKEQWPAIGVGFNVIVADFNTVMDSAYEQRAFDKFDMWTQGWSLSSDPDPTALLSKQAYDTPGGFNPGGYYNERGEELFKAGRQEFDAEKRAEIYGEWALLANDTLPMMFNAVRESLWGVAPGVTGFETMNPFYNWVSCILDVDIAQ